MEEERKEERKEGKEERKKGKQAEREEGRKEEEENNHIFRGRKNRRPCLTGQKQKGAESPGPFQHRH